MTDFTWEQALVTAIRTVCMAWVFQSFLAFLVARKIGNKF